jgi:uncharacterized DUF497 family protein
LRELRAARAEERRGDGRFDTATALPYNDVVEGFEWDPAKAAANLRKHCVSFTAAARIFEDTFRLEWEDVREEYGEERYVTIGMVNAEVLAVAHPVRGDVIRMISARRATNPEKAQYHENRPI